MALVGHRSRQMAFHNGASAPVSHAILAAATSPFYHHAVLPQDAQPDRPIGYGAFGVVW